MCISTQTHTLVYTHARTHTHARAHTHTKRGKHTDTHTLVYTHAHTRAHTYITEEGGTIHDDACNRGREALVCVCVCVCMCMPRSPVCVWCVCVYDPIVLAGLCRS